MKQTFFYKNRTGAFVLAQHYENGKEARRAARELSRALKIGVRVVWAMHGLTGAQKVKGPRDWS